MSKVIGRRGAVIEPLEQISPGKETLVETAHNLGITGAAYNLSTIAPVNSQHTER